MMTSRVALLVVVIKATLLLFPTGVLLEEGYKPVAPIRKDRVTLFKDIVKWMAFRVEGKPILTESEWENYNFLDKFFGRYTADKNYRAFIVAVKDGVIRKLTLGPGESCTSYADKYKNPYTKRVHWPGIKKFTFWAYDHRSDNSIKFCDFRRGLVCDSTGHCNCRKDAKLLSITGSSKTRCQLEEGMICTFEDLRFGATDRYWDSFITETIFSPERPESCVESTQCRFIESSRKVPRCYDMQKHANDWWPHRQITPGPLPPIQELIPIGEECSLDTPMMATNGYGQCDDDYGSGFQPRPRGDPLVCSIKDPTSGSLERDGICTHELGAHQIRFYWLNGRYYDLWATNFILGFVDHHTVPLGWPKLASYYEKYLTQVAHKVFPKKEDDDTVDYGNENKEPLLVIEEGKPCNKDKTDKMKEIWKFYSTLTKAVQEADLNKWMDEMVKLVQSDSGFCKVYWSYDAKGNPSPALTCASGATDADGNDGTCVKDASNQDRTFADKVQEISNSMMEDEAEIKKQNEVYDNLPDKEKDPVCREFKIGQPCPENELNKYYCIKDYRDQENGMYGPKPECKLLKEPTDLVCRRTKIGIYGDHEECEEVQLKRMLKEFVSHVGTKARGADCDRDEEEWVRKLIKGNFDRWLYDKYAELKRDKKSFDYCDRTRLLKCGKRECECYPGTKPRTVTIGDVPYESDYCYAESGSCNDFSRLELVEDKSWNEKEREAIKAHYGEPEENCDGGNFCLFVDKKAGMCTEKDTGNTGYDGTKPWPPPTTTESPGGEPGGGPGGDGGLGGFEPIASASRVGAATLTLFTVLAAHSYEILF